MKFDSTYQVKEIPLPDKQRETGESGLFYGIERNY